MSKSFLLYPVRVAGHYIVAVAGGMTIGLILEGTVGRFYSHTIFEPFAPCIAMTAFALGAVVSYHLDRVHLASWTWTIGLIWLLVAIRELTHSWDPRWAHTRTAWEYARSQLLPVPLYDNCGNTECLYQLLFAVPFIASVAYSAGGFARKHFGAKNQRAMRPNKSQSSAPSHSSQETEN
jgi:hypothetical protein